MNRRQSLCGWFVACLGVIAFYGATPAQAQFQLLDIKGEADANISVSAAGFPTLPPGHAKITPPGTLAFTEVEQNFGGLHFEAAAFQNAFGINAAFAEAGGPIIELNSSYSVTSNTSYSVRVRTVTAMTGTVPFKFVINGGELRIKDFAQFDPFFDLDGASVEAEIGIDADTWRFTAVLTKDTSGQPDVIEGFLGNRDDFGFNPSIFPTLTPTIVGNDAVVTIPNITGIVTLDLADFEPLLASLGGVRFTYDMEAKVEMSPVGQGGQGITGGLAGITDPFALGTPSDTSDDLGGNFSMEGVQFFLGDQLLNQFPVVPEPGTAAVLLVGLGALGTATRRRRAA